MHSVLLRLQNQAEVYKEMQKMRLEWLERQHQVLRYKPLERAVLKKVGLWNMKDEDFYANNNIYYNVNQIYIMCLVFGLFNVKYHKELDSETCSLYNGIDEIPIECINTGKFVYELKEPFTKAFFESLLDNECNILEFGPDYIFKQNEITYGTYKLFELFNNQNFTSYGKS